MYRMVNMNNPFKKFDDFFIQRINRDLKKPIFNVFFYYYTNIAGPTVIGIFVLVSLSLGRGFFGDSSKEMVLSLFLSTLFVQFLKRVFNRNRPYWILENLNTYGIDLRDYSFPSGHTTAAFTVATTLSLNFPMWAILLMIMALLVAISRVYLAVHYPTDVVAGLLIGVLTSLIVHIYVFDPVMGWIF